MSHSNIPDTSESVSLKAISSSKLATLLDNSGIHNSIKMNKNKSGKATTSMFQEFARQVKPENLQGFFQILPKLIQEISEMSEFRSQGKIWKLIEYNLPPSTQFCATQLLATHEYFQEIRSQSQPESSLELAFVLGWCNELITASIIVVDDLVDGSTMRFGKPCWYQVDKSKEQRLFGVYDALLLERCAFALLEKYFKNHKAYLDLLNLFRYVVTCNTNGLTLEGDLNSDFKKNGRICSMEEYCEMRKLQNGYNLSYLPIAAAAILNGIKNPLVLKQLEYACLSIAWYFAILRDHIDGFEETNFMGSEGTDIGNGRVTWLLLKAYESATPAQQKTLCANLGIPSEENIKRVLQVYKEVDVSAQFRKWQQTFFQETISNIGGFSSELPKAFLVNLLHICQRNLAHV